MSRNMLFIWLGAMERAIIGSNLHFKGSCVHIEAERVCSTRGGARRPRVAETRPPSSTPASLEVKQSRHPIDQWPVYNSAGVLSFCGIMMFSAMPIVVAVLTRHYGLREGQTGDIVGCYFVGVVLASLTTFPGSGGSIGDLLRLPAKRSAPPPSSR